MKVKLKLDLQSIKDVALEHGEKLALGAVALVFLMFVYTALGREALDAGKQPDRLATKAEQARAHASQSDFDPARDGLAVVEYVDRAKRDTIDAALFAAPQVFDPPVADPKTKRDDPKLLPIEALRADAGFGVFALTAGEAAAPGDRRPQTSRGGGGTSDAGHKPSPDADLDARPYVVVTGLVPRHNQAVEYGRVFEGALGEDPARDQPQYVSCVLERAEIDPQQPDNLAWAPVPSDEEFVSRWEAKAQEVIHDDLLEKALVTDLGPLVGANWGEAVRHPRLLAPAGGPRQQADASNRDRNDRRPSTTGAAANGPIEYRLCRAFDFSVEPSKKYRYRIKAKLRNPNHGLPIPWVKNPESPAVEFVETDWSDPTAIVAVPDRFGVLAGRVTKDSRSSDPEVMMMVTAIGAKGIEAAIELAAQRASALDTATERANARDPRNSAFEQLDNVDFHTGIVVVDIHGGEPLSRKPQSTLTGPIEVLVRDAQGNLRVRNEFDDQPLVQDRTPAKETAEEDKPNRDPVPKGPARPR